MRLKHKKKLQAFLFASLSEIILCLMAPSKHDLRKDEHVRTTIILFFLFWMTHFSFIPQYKKIIKRKTSSLKLHVQQGRRKMKAKRWLYNSWPRTHIKDFSHSLQLTQLSRDAHNGIMEFAIYRSNRKLYQGFSFSLSLFCS